jgi:glycosyltransferase involved in cell wall biosynthesis
LPDDRIKLINNGGLRGKIQEILFQKFECIPQSVYKWAKSIHPKLLHVFSGYDATMIMRLAKKLDIPLVVSFLGSDATIKDEYYEDFSPVRGHYYLLRRKELTEMVSMVVVPSEFLKRKVIDHGFDEDKIKVIPHGIDLEQFNKSDKEAEFGHILFVGRLRAVKGLNYLIEALAKIKNQYPEISLTVIGDGPLREEYELLAQQKLKSNFQFLGYQPSKIVKDYFERAYIFCMPSISMPTGQAESFGVVFLEAQAMGVPVVSFNSGGISEVVAHGKTGFLCEEKNVECLADKIIKLLKDPELHDRMSVAGRKRVEHFFDLNKQNKILESCYDLLINKR